MSASQFNETYVNEDDIEAFRQALTIDNTISGASTPKVEFIRSHNDWRPIHQPIHASKRHNRRRKSYSYDDFGQSIGYSILRWPILLLACMWLISLSILYLLVRVYVIIYEQTVTWRGHRRLLRQKLSQVTSYEEWITIAEELDAFLGASRSWKSRPQSSLYNYHTVSGTVNQLKAAREAGDAEKVLSVLDACVKNNFCGSENPGLYSQCYYGTKNLVARFKDEVTSGLQYVLQSPEISVERKYRFFKSVDKNYGRTALCLSGGGSYAYYHFGVIKALLDEDMLPNVITGTSGGGLVAAMACTRTNDELKGLLVPELADKITACEESLAVLTKRWWRTGARYDAVEWARKATWFTLGSMTFKEAYERTGKILNISTVPADPNSPVILCNYITSPNAVIWSTLLASAAVPGILNPVVLMMKSPTGELSPYSFGNKWRDGSLRTDIPLRALNTYFNVNFSIVSQVNPHVVLFFYSPRGAVGNPVPQRKGKGWRGGFVGSALEGYIKHDLNKWLKVLKDLRLIPNFMGQDWSNVFLQKFEGTVTLSPKTIPSDLIYILTDPTRETLARMIAEGARAVYPKLLFIKHRIMVERAIIAGIRETSMHSGGSRVIEEDANSDYFGMNANADPQAPQIGEIELAENIDVDPIDDI
ncbi:hypothetical protein CANCADRAFT_134120 [Tortispora caseinolytica NRRL Y-17796]|uniref:PNPLA domain-containing protein n=1 Tax=Tortispora caseinolytica NRRL Y-17796 TaxID=767744 RepID=A0A1E4TBJ4_9ASCO|nr:hypothetical protein CANCADRAFT_134120 [Tortispora caseinolytica NRRL Y-17796]